MIRRLPALLALVLALGVAVALLLHHQDQVAARTGHFAVVFDDARGLLAGDEVEIAGAPAGEVTGLSLTAGNKALISASIDRRFLPLHTNASCSVTTEGLISQPYLSCSPGTASHPVLRGDPATIAVSHTSEPVELTDLFNIFNLPTRERTSVLLDELGISTAAQGQNLNAIIRRANPALTDARQAIALLDDQQSQLSSLLSSTNTILAGAVGDRGRIRRFISGAADLTQLTADHRSQLSQAIAKLPALLSQATPALGQVDSFATGATPLVAQVRDATPQITTLFDRIGPVLRVGAPALRSLSHTLTVAIPTAKATTPVFATVDHYISESLPSARQIAQVLVNLQQRGFVEDFLGLVYYLAALNGRYDATGHVGAAYFINPNGGACDMLASTPVAGCSANYSTSTTATAAPDRTSNTQATATTPTVTQTTPATTTTGAEPDTGAGTATRPNPVATTLNNLGSGVSTTSQRVGATLGNLLNYLLTK